jgi:hypothetical protein
MQTATVLWIGVALALCAGCSSLQVSQDFDTHFDFSQLHTFGFLSAPPGRTGVDDLTLRRVQDAIAKELTAKGYVKSDNPDFGVAVHGGKKTETDIESYGYGWGWWGPGDVDVYQYDVGTLIVDFVDSKQKEMVWRGTAEDVLGATTPEEKTAQIDAAIAKMLAPFPPGS